MKKTDKNIFSKIPLICNVSSYSSLIIRPSRAGRGCIPWVRAGGQTNAEQKLFGFWKAEGEKLCPT